MSARTISVQLPKYHAAQALVASEARRFNVLACGRRWGKTEFEKRLACETAIAGYPVGWFAPTYKILIKAFDEIRKTLQPLLTTGSSKSEKTLTLITGGVIEFWTLEDPDAGRSRKYKRVIIDEAGMCATLHSQWPEAIRPTLADYQGDAWLGGTPKGRNFFYEAYQRGVDPLQTEWAAWQMPTSENPYIKPVEIAALKFELSERAYAQEIDAQFLDDGGGVFRNVRACSIGIPQAAIAQHQYVGGLDWGRTNDYTVLSIFDTMAQQQVYLDRFNGIEYSLQRQRVADAFQRYPNLIVYAESNSIGQPNIEALQRDSLYVIPFQTTNASKSQAVESLSLALERKTITLLNDPIQISELEAYESTRLPSGLYRYSAPDGMHDDTVMATMIAWYGCSNRSQGVF